MYLQKYTLRWKRITVYACRSINENRLISDISGLELNLHVCMTVRSAVKFVKTVRVIEVRVRIFAASLAWSALYPGHALEMKDCTQTIRTNGCLTAFLPS